VRFSLESRQHIKSECLEARSVQNSLDKQYSKRILRDEGNIAIEEMWHSSSEYETEETKSHKAVLIDVFYSGQSLSKIISQGGGDTARNRFCFYWTAV